MIWILFLFSYLCCNTFMPQCSQCLWWSHQWCQKNRDIGFHDYKSDWLYLWMPFWIFNRPQSLLGLHLLFFFLLFSVLFWAYVLSQGFFFLPHYVNWETWSLIRACLHEGGGPQVGVVACGGLPHLTCKRDPIKMRDYMDRRVPPPPNRVTSPSWGPPPPRKQALTV